ncbi:MAG: cytidine deaminase [Bacillota bacterium]
MQQELEERLVKQAIQVRQKAYAPYSNFAVGAAVLTAEGEIYTGCNVENMSYSLTNCAERTAVFKAVSEVGEVKLDAIAVVADTEKPCIPCGACRQVLAEFGSDDLVVIMANTEGVRIIKQLGDIFWTAANEELLK